MRTSLLLRGVVFRVLGVACAMSAAAPAFSQGWVCAEGGGISASQPWASEIFGWMLEKGEHGAVVIIGAIPLDEDDRPALLTKLGAASVRSLVVTRENADAQETFDAIAAAKVVFIRGGDQGRYVSGWKGTKTEAALRRVFEGGGVIGGTSAGCAVLGEWSYSAVKDSLSPSEALADAHHPDLTLEHGFLGLVPGVIFDTHFNERGRLPRLAVMLAHIRENEREREPGGPPVAGLGVDARTALCIAPDGTAEVRGEGAVTLLRLGRGSRSLLSAGSPPTVTDLEFARLEAGTRLRLNPLSFIGGATDARADAAPLLETPREQKSWRVRGDHRDDAQTGAFVLAETPGTPPRFTLDPAKGTAPGLVFFPAAWARGGVQPRFDVVAGLAAAAPSVRTVVWLDEGTHLRGEGAGFRVEGSGSPARAAAVLVRAGLPESLGRVPATVTATGVLHVLAPGWGLDADGALTPPVQDPAGGPGGR